MASKLEIKSRIRSVDSTMKITRAMQLVAASKLKKCGYIKVDGVSSVFCFIWGWEEPTWGLPFQFHGVFYVMISMKGP